MNRYAYDGTAVILRRPDGSSTLLAVFTLPDDALRFATQCRHAEVKRGTQYVIRNCETVVKIDDDEKRVPAGRETR